MAKHRKPSPRETATDPTTATETATESTAATATETESTAAAETTAASESNPSTETTMNAETTSEIQSAETSEPTVPETMPAEASGETEIARAEGDASETEAAPEPQGRDRIQQQLEALKQREAELRRELAMANHPGLADAIRSIEGRAYGVSRVEAKMAAGLSKSELRRKETLEKKLATALERRAEIDTQVAALEAELLPLGQQRLAAFAAERAEALITLADMLRTHEGALASAQLDVATLVPALGAWEAELQALAASRAAS